MLKLVARCDNFAGLVDASLDWQFMIDLMMEARSARPGFLLISGNELMLSPAAIERVQMRDHPGRDLVAAPHREGDAFLGPLLTEDRSDPARSRRATEPRPRPA